MPSNETVEKEITPNYDLYLTLLAGLKDEKTELETKGADVTALKNTYGNIESKLNQTKTAIESESYYTANVLLSEIKTLMDGLETDIDNTEILPKAQEGAGIDLFLVIIIVIIIAAIGSVLAYLFWPTEEKRGLRTSLSWAPETVKKQKFGFHASKIFTKKEQQTFLIGKGEHSIFEGITEKIKNIFKRKKKKETKENEKGGFFYDFKK